MLRRAATGADAAAAEDVEDCAAVAPDVDQYEYLFPVDILSKLPKDFYEKVERKKWQERREALEAVQKLAEAPKLDQGDYSDLLRALKKVVAKDSNVLLSTMAAKCIALLSTGLRKKFHQHAVGCIEVLIEKFCEKEMLAVQTLREAVDACYVSTTLDAIGEGCVAALDHKTPSVKAETAYFLARCFAQCTPATLPKKTLKMYIAALLKAGDDSASEVREAAYDALGTAMMVITEKVMMPFVPDVDSLKMAKIKESYDKAVVTSKGGIPKAPAAASTGRAKAVMPAAQKAAAPPGTKGAPGAKPAAKKGPDSVAASSSTASQSTAINKEKGSRPNGRSRSVPERVACRELLSDSVDVVLSPSQHCARRLLFEIDVRNLQSPVTVGLDQSLEVRKLLQLLEEKQKVVDTLLSSLASLEQQAERLRTLRKVVYSPARLSESGQKQRKDKEKELEEGTGRTPLDDLVPNVIPSYVKNLVGQIEKLQADKVEQEVLVQQLIKANLELKAEVYELNVILKTQKQCQMVQVGEKSFEHLLKTKFEIVDLKEKVKTLEEKISILSERQVLAARLDENTLESAVKETEAVVSGVSQNLSMDLVANYRRELLARRKLQDEVMELKGNLKIYCRIRPLLKIEKDSGKKIVVRRDVDDASLVTVEHKDRTQKFSCDVIFDENSNQEEIFDETSSLVLCCIDGFNVSIFAYGQSGAGKSYTLEGIPTDPGLNQRALRALFFEIEKRGSDWVFDISVSVVEIYQETISDLLSESRAKSLKVKMVSSGGLEVPGLTWAQVSSIEDINQILTVAHTNRTTSQRSHAVMCFVVDGVNIVTGTQTTGRLNFIELAASEPLQKPNTEGLQMKETPSINQSLLLLGDVLHAIYTKRLHVPFRNSKLTYLLQKSLGGNGKILMIAQVAPTDDNSGESISTLSYVQRIRSVETAAKIKTVVRSSKEQPF